MTYYEMLKTIQEIKEYLETELERVKNLDIEEYKKAIAETR